MLSPQQQPAKLDISVSDTLHPGAKPESFFFSGESVGRSLVRPLLSLLFDQPGVQKQPFCFPRSLDY